MNRVLFIWLFSSFSVCLAQNRIDSLQLAFSKAQEDTAKIDLLFELYLAYEYVDTLKSRESLEKSLQLSEKIRDTLRMAKSHNYFGDFLQLQSKYDAAINYYENGFILAKKADFHSGMAAATIGLGNSYWRKGNLSKALEYHRRNIAMAIQFGDSLSIASSYNNIGNIYNSEGDYTNAMAYYIKSSDLYHKLGNLRNYAITQSNIGQLNTKLENYPLAEKYLKISDSLFNNLNDLGGSAYVQKSLAIVYKHQGKFDKSIRYNNKALEYYESMGFKNRTAEVQQVLGNTYVELKNFKKALPYYLSALEINEETNDSLSLAMVQKELGNIYLNLGEIDKSKNALEQALAISEEVGAPLTIMDSHEVLAQLYEKSENFYKALYHQKMYSKWRDSLYTKEKRDLALDIEAKYQNKQKEEEIKLLEAKNTLNALQIKKRENERNTIIGVSLLILLILGLLYNQFRLKQRANRKLKELDKMKSHFFANISHEFRTPLTLIKGPVDKLSENPSENLSHDNIKMIQRNTNRLLTLVNQLLDLSKIDAGTLKLEPTEGNIFGCISTVANSFESLAQRRNIDYQITIPRKILMASFDMDKLEKILYNLLSNAFKFTSDHSWIGFSATVQDGKLRIQVEDSGRGIPEKDLPHIFERFYQVERGNTKGDIGSGIGLSLCHDLLQLMGGTISVESVLGQGTTFSLQIPVETVSISSEEKLVTETISPKEPLKNHIAIKSDTRNIPTVLLVEDNTDMQAFVSEILLPHYRVNAASHGREGLKKALKNPPDLVVTDLMMPKMDGLQLCRELKSNLHTSHIPIVMLTAKAGMENKIEGLEIGADDYVVKPFAPEELLARIKNLIEQRKKLRELYQSNNAGINPKSVTVTPMDEQFLQKLLNLLEAHYANPDFGVPKMQQALSMSKTQLHRKTKALTNEAPGELLRNFRLKRAAQLLSNKADSVTQIAYGVGFNNISYFAKCFKDYFGVSPSAYHAGS